MSSYRSHSVGFSLVFSQILSLIALSKSTHFVLLFKEYVGQVEILVTKIFDPYSFSLNMYNFLYSLYGYPPLTWSTNSWFLYISPEVEYVMSDFYTCMDLVNVCAWWFAEMMRKQIGFLHYVPYLTLLIHDLIDFCIPGHDAGSSSFCAWTRSSMFPTPAKSVSKLQTGRHVCLSFCLVLFLFSLLDVLFNMKLLFTNLKSGYTVLHSSSLSIVRRLMLRSSYGRFFCMVWQGIAFFSYSTPLQDWYNYYHCLWI